MVRLLTVVHSLDIFTAM